MAGETVAIIFRGMAPPDASGLSFRSSGIPSSDGLRLFKEEAFLPPMRMILAAFLLVGSPLLSGKPLKAGALRTELQFSPEAVGTSPRFTWRLESDEQGKRQTAYQILAATSLEKLDEKNADLWNSGQQAGGQKNLVPWKGKPLKGRSLVHWKVRVWDEKKVAGPWSEPTTFKVDGKTKWSTPRRISSFESSSPQLNSLFNESITVLEKRLARFANGDVPALGKGDQVHRSARAMMFHFDSVPHLTHWLRLTDASMIEGTFFPVQPNSKAYGSMASEGAILTHLPVWLMGGDSAYPKERWKLYEKHMIAREKNDRAFKGTKWGETTELEGMTPEYLDLVYLGFTTRLIRELSLPSQQPMNVIRFKDYADRIKNSFQKQYVNPDGSLKVKSQSAHVLALRSAVLEPKQQQKVVADLIASITKNGSQVGPIGAYFLPGVLSLTGNQDLAVKLLNSLGEKEKAAYLGNGISEWLMAFLAGLDTSFPGFQQIMIAPRIPESDELRWVKAECDSLSGKVRVHWQKLKDGGIQVDCTIPPGAISKIILPARKESRIMVDGKEIAQTPTLQVISRNDQLISLISQSGTYSIVIK